MAIMARAAERRAAEREAAKRPETWGINPGLARLATSSDVEVIADPNRRGRIRNARRSDAFSLLFEAGGLSEEQHRASQRYWNDWVLRSGAGTGSGDFARERVDGLQVDEAAIRQRMMDAGNRIVDAHDEIGRGSAMLLTALVEPLAMRGEVRVWREQVRAATGETERHAQAAAVRAACENLRLGYEAIDRRDETRRRRAMGRLAAG